jgi:taurine dioxygenase
MQFTPVNRHIGADVHGVNLARPLSEEDLQTIRERLHQHLVLFFREQEILTPEQHMALAAKFGELEPTTFAGGSTNCRLAEHVLRIDEQGDGDPQLLHVDGCYRPDPVLGTILQAQILPEIGGDTLFVSAYAAYEMLSSKMRAFLDGLECYQSLDQMRAISDKNFKLGINPDEFPPVKVPVVRTHPGTGRKYLNVNALYTTHIDGLRVDESAILLNFLYGHLRSPEFQVRLRWNSGDIAFWDNWACQHAPVQDYAGHRRMQRVSILRGH